MDEIRFTPEEIEALVKAGEITEDDVHLLPNADDKKMAATILLKNDQVNVAGAPLGPPGLASTLGSIPGALSGLGVGAGIKKVIGSTGELAGELGGAAIGSAMGHPIIGMILGRQFGRGARGLARSRPAPVQAKPNLQRATPQTLPDRGRTGELTEQVSRGVQNDFRGPVHIRRPSTLGGPDTAGLKNQPNASTKRTAEDVREQVTGSSRRSYEDPRSTSADYHPSKDVSSTQKKVASALDKKPVARRKPKK